MVCNLNLGRLFIDAIFSFRFFLPTLTPFSFSTSTPTKKQGMSLICMSRPVADTVRLETQSDYGYSLGTVEWAGATGSIEGGEANTIMGRPNKEA